MKLNRSILCLAAGFLASSVAMAQTGASTGTQWGSGQDSIRCRQNLSLFSSFVKAGSIQDAIAPWEEAYKECPASSKNIYLHGATILKHRISGEGDEAKRIALIDALLKLYDDRLKYFGDDSKYGLDVITNYKIIDYTNLMGEKADYDKVYDWAKMAIESAGENSVPQLFNYFTYASQLKARKDNKLIEQYIDDYLKVSELLDKQIEVATGNERLLQAAEANKQVVDQAFAASGLAGCDVLEKVYTSDKVEAHKTDKGYLETTCNLFINAGCDNPVYFQAAKYLFDMAPSAKSAMGLAGKAVQEKKYGEAQSYLQKAIELATNNGDKLKCYELMAQLAMQQRNYSAARSASNYALQLNPKSGRSLMILAQLLASSADNIFPTDKIKQRAVFYLVIDRLNAAAAADPAIASSARSLIAQYSRMLPSQADIFMHPELNKGQSFTVPGHGTTTIR